MHYVVAAYAVALVTLVLYGLNIGREWRALRRQLERQPE